MERSVVDFPAPFAPIKRDDLAFVNLERDPLQRLDRAVVRMDVFDAQQRAVTFGLAGHAIAALPRYASMTRSFFWISLGVPSAIFSP